MNSTAIQEATESIIDLNSPSIQSLKFAITMINLALMYRVDDVDYTDGYRTALEYIRKVLSNKLEDETHD